MNTFNQFEQVNSGILSQYLLITGIILLICDILICLSSLFLRSDAIYKNTKGKIAANTALLLILTAFTVIGFIICSDEIISLLFGIPHFAFSLLITFFIFWGFFHTQGIAENTMQVLESLVGVIEAGDENLDGHSLHVQNLTMLMYDYLPFLMRLKINSYNLQYAALLLDVGKLGIPRNVIDKKGKLTPDEKDLIQRHPEICVEIFKKIPSFNIITSWVKYHHERVDGNGYNKLKGKEIPLASRLLAIADTYSAITMERSYRPKLPYENAIAELQLVAGTQLDRDLVEIFCAIPRMKVVACMDDVKKRMEKYKIGTFR